MPQEERVPPSAYVPRQKLCQQNAAKQPVGSPRAGWNPPNPRGWIFFLGLFSAASVAGARAEQRSAGPNPKKHALDVLQKIKALCNKYPLQETNAGPAFSPKQTEQRQQPARDTQHKPEAPPLPARTQRPPHADPKGQESVAAKAVPTASVAPPSASPSAAAPSQPMDAAPGNPKTLPQGATAPPEGPMEAAGPLLESYDAIKDWIAFDPAAQRWVPIRAFAILHAHPQTQAADTAADWLPYERFWAYDAQKKEWHNASLLPHLRQTNGQPGNASYAGALGAQPQCGAANAAGLLEELLGPRAPLPKVPPEEAIEQVQSPGRLSMEFSLGTGALFCQNQLRNLRLLVQEGNTYFLVGKSTKAYKPNWFWGSVVPVPGLDAGQLHRVAHGTDYQAAFRGKGIAIPATLAGEYAFRKGFLVGAGTEIAWSRIAQLQHNDASIPPTPFRVTQPWTAQGRWFARGGWYAFRSVREKVLVDLRCLAVWHFGYNPARAFVFAPYLHRATAWDVGIRHEKQLTDRFSFATRLAVERQWFNQFPARETENIDYKQHAVSLQLGLLVHWNRPDRADKRTPTANPTEPSVQRQPGLPAASTESKYRGLLDLD